MFLKECALGAIIVSIGLASISFARSVDTPLKQVVSYSVYEDPNDPDSDLIWMIVAYLTKSDSDGNSIGWSVDKIKLFEVNAAPTPDREWIDATPTVDTPDGLWWIKHADPNSPDLAEFDMPPFIDGLAYAQDPSDSDLDYEFEGVVYNEPPGGPHFTLTAALNMLMIEDITKLLEKLAEPVEIHNTELPPVGL